ncbi:nucleoside transporter [Acinetobacter sp. ANC 4558]|uniref:nicotinamide riboside transporter PnuC n=1 Tax=Acinetobacter sp. ANC 4558 TaxID=1977876 RepID=UPI000A32C513|nr:nicotinamide riboside transporter PnuC [Acinetobacter sp. ANC 4558]OTG86212.1 nucleoside transporter [Acinetobacter sp. ANC 4558]
MTLFEIVSVIISIIAVILTIKRHLWCWFFNFFACVLYAILFFEFKLYGETILQVFFMGMAIYGYMQWKKGLSEQHELIISDLKLNSILIQILITAGVGLSFGALLAYFTDAAVPWLDAQLAAFSLLATYWSGKKYLSTWRLWVIVDIIYVAMFIYKDLYPTAGLYAMFVILAGMGWLQWQKIYRQQMQGSLIPS